MTVNEPREWVVLVAVTVETPTRPLAEVVVQATLTVGTDLDTPVTSWWVAEDDRLDGSDNDSAVFVKKGWQDEAYQQLHAAGLTGSVNDPRAARSQDPET